MYAVKVFHGYITKQGERTREKQFEKLQIFQTKEQAEAFANKIGGRVKQLG